MKAYVSTWKKLPRSIRKEYEQGGTLLSLSIKHNVTAGAVRKALLFFKTKMRRPGTRLEGGNNAVRKLSDDDLLLALKLDDEGVSHSEIARRVAIKGGSVSRERIRQVCSEAGHPTRRSRVVPKAEAIRAGRLARQQAKEDMIRNTSEAWKAGADWKQLCLIVFGEDKGLHRITTKIVEFRRNYGKEMFPYRRKGHWATKTVKQQADRVHGMSEAWKATGDYMYIKRRFGFKGYSSVVASIARYRKIFPDMFPTKPDILKVRVEQYEKEIKNKTHGTSKD